MFVQSVVSTIVSPSVLSLNIYPSVFHCFEKAVSFWGILAIQAFYKFYKCILQMFNVEPLCSIELQKKLESDTCSSAALRYTFEMLHYVSTGF